MSFFRSFTSSSSSSPDGAPADTSAPVAPAPAPALSQQQQPQQPQQPQPPAIETVGSMLSGLDFTQASRALSPVGQLGSGVEYIFTDDSPLHAASGGFVPSRSWTDDLCYGTGTAYLSGLLFGGSWGFVQGMRIPLPVASAKLRVNAVLNAMTRRGPFVANSIGVLALMYNSMNSAITSQVGTANAPAASVMAAASAGALFKATSTLRLDSPSLLFLRSETDPTPFSTRWRPANGHLERHVRVGRSPLASDQANPRGLAICRQDCHALVRLDAPGRGLLVFE
ncbi:mitochondrial import inner membrane translocase subunit [Allomyces macrogynus ATCC 38327]|uniref:Mitochondrial import inner membrane translocase subunit n=1 Tax=Allomyces macrogynus (strain ATCC 38327) TaxID=578462 RepID=A0A0L0SKE8_ALLM3|nr:mitochondrial import inner membrane translocase subunit [Allomyces macrogynus ATCC 38327]|eukprot:KNE62976.1 mitochondrial import inner membrane translocase subunit [Allomyces macrogynus ATCC 38327]